MKKLACITLIFFAVHFFAQSQTALAPSPPMGWNSWNWFGKKGINEENMKQCMDAIVQNGLLDTGYEYFVIDGGWRDNKLGPNGELLANPQRFPHGMKAMADYAHSLGLKFGLHTVPGTNDCGGDPVGGYGHEKVQVKEFADWGLDFIKLDKCRFVDGWNEDTLKQTYIRWRKLLDKSGRKIVLSISAYQWRDWYPGVGQMARTTGDISAKVSKGALFDSSPRSVLGIADINNQSAPFAGNGYWNDPDMLAIGDQGLTEDEQKTHFALWCVMSAPLFLGNDPRNMTPEELKIITNADCIAIDQDPVEQGNKVKDEAGIEVWLKHLKNGKAALLALNKDNTGKKDVLLNLNEFGISGKSRLKGVFTNEMIRAKKNNVKVDLAKHACFLLLADD